MKVTVLGAGSFGFSIGQILADNGHDVLFWSVEEDVNLDINENKTNVKYGFTTKLDASVRATNDIKEAIEFSDYVFNVVPTQFVRQTFENINKVISSGKYFVNCSKGIEPHTLMFIEEIIADCVDEQFNLGFSDVTGPSHAELLAQRNLTALTVGSKNEELASTIANLIRNDYIKTQISSDVLTLEYASSAKNVIALGAGMLRGLGHGENIIAAFISKGFNEIIEVGKAIDANLETLLSFGGLGDLIVTATSSNSRNVNFGTYLGQGKSLEEAEALTKQVAEGVRSLESMYEMASKNNLNAPIVKTMNDIIYNGVNVTNLVNVFDEVK